MPIITINPATEEILNEYVEDSVLVILNKINRAKEIQRNWSKASIETRAKHLKSVANLLRSNIDRYSKLMSLEMGKPILQGRSEVEKCAWVCDYYAENGEKFLSNINIKTELTSSYVSFRPIGTVLAIMPWNFPFWQVFRFAAPALMAGNAALLKHSRNTMGCGIEIEHIFRDAGCPEGLFSNLVIGSEPVKRIIEHKDIAAVTLTGSTPVGAEVASVAGKNIKKTVMELGGSDPYIILSDAEISKAAGICAFARLINSGQSCIAAKRFIVEKSVAEEFENEFVKAMESYVMGNPLDEQTQVGPQARKDLQLELQEQVDKTIAAGAKLLLGGEIQNGTGYFYPPTILTQVKEGMLAYHEEIFGPVASIVYADNAEEAVRIANDSVFGLGAAIFTRDVQKGKFIAENLIEAGSCFVNTFVRSDPRLPFGGIKESGYGRELSDFGIREFVNIKTVCIG